MPKSLAFEKPEINLVTSMEEAESLAQPDDPFRIVLLGDWSGRANRNLSMDRAEFAGLLPLSVDRDNFDDVMSQLGVEISLNLDDEESASLTLRFNKLDDFHPDRIFEGLEVFDRLRQTRQRLDDPAMFAEAANEVRSWTRIETEAGSPEFAQQESAPASGLSELSGGNLLDQIIGEAEGQSQPSQPPAAPDDLQSMLQSIVKPHLVTGEGQQQAELIASVDEVTSSLMRSILHHPDFQALESAWRALHFLISRLETGANLKLYLLDISKAELAAALLSTEDEQTKEIDKIFVEQSGENTGGASWAVLAGNYTFDQTLEDIELLSRLGQLARKAGAPFISAASPHILGCDSLATTPDPDHWQPSVAPEEGRAWEALRQSSEASSMGLALPGFLQRLPYGKETEPVEHFDFEEMAGEPKHFNYLWGNPCFACVYLLAQAFSAEGWEMRPGSLQEIEGLPLHIYEEDGQTQVKPCAEALLSLRAAETILQHGLMPLLSFKGSDKIRLAMFQSLADPLTSLSGRWH